MTEQTTSNIRKGIVNADLNFDQFAQIRGVRGYQFGKEVYSSMLRFKDLERFLEVFPRVQRGMSVANVKSIKKYILSAIDDKSQEYMRFFNSITVTARGKIIYDDDKRTILIDTKTPLSINDGQHRVAGIEDACKELENRIKKATDLNEKQALEDDLDILENMTVPVIIFNGLDEKQESQLFFDLNTLQRRPSKNANIRLSQTDLIATMSKEISETNRYFVHYGVENDKQSIFRSNENTFLLTTIYNSIKELLNANLTYDKNFLKEKNYNRVKTEVNSLFDKILYVLPNDMDTKGKYIIEKSYCLMGICKFVSHMKDSGLFASEDDIYEIIKTVDWTNKNPDWIKYGGIRSMTGSDNIVFGGNNSGKKAVFTCLVDRADEFLKNKERTYLKNA